MYLECFGQVFVGYRARCYACCYVDLFGRYYFFQLVSGRLRSVYPDSEFRLSYLAHEADVMPRTPRRKR